MLFNASLALYVTLRPCIEEGTGYLRSYAYFLTKSRHWKINSAFSLWMLRIHDLSPPITWIRDRRQIGRYIKCVYNCSKINLQLALHPKCAYNCSKNKSATCNTAHHKKLKRVKNKCTNKQAIDTFPSIHMFSSWIIHTMALCFISIHPTKLYIEHSTAI